MKHALSFDIEDWFHIPGIPHVERRGEWDKFSERSVVEKKTNLILEILDEYDTKATFFILGWIAKKYPHLVKKIALSGHEIASHGYWHYRVYTLTRKSFKNYLQQSIHILEDVSGKKVKGFRAPSFSIIPGSEWAFEFMMDAGLEYDASLFPAQRGYGGYNVERYPHQLPSSVSETHFIELPMSVLDFGKIKLPFSGGGYLRFWHSSILRYGFNKLEKEKIPGVVYLHPRDFGVDCPKVKVSPLKHFKCYFNLESTRKKLEMLLSNYQFGTCEEVLKGWFSVSELSELYENDNNTTQDIAVIN